MHDFIKHLRSTQSEEHSITVDVLCFGCATILPYSGELKRCSCCGAELDLDRFNALYSYSSTALRYGHQYHEYYVNQKKLGSVGSVKPYLAEMSEVYKYIALAIVSGIIGGASWDITRAAIRKIISQYEQEQTATLPRKEPAVDLNEVEKIAKNISGYANASGFGHMDKSVAPLILEEMFADSVTDHLNELEAIFKLRAANKKVDKKKQRALKLQKRLMKKIAVEKIRLPQGAPILRLWSDIKDGDDF